MNRVVRLSNTWCVRLTKQIHSRPLDAGSCGLLHLSKGRSGCEHTLAQQLGVFGRSSCCFRPRDTNDGQPGTLGHSVDTENPLSMGARMCRL